MGATQTLQPQQSITRDQLLEDDEVIIVVDDYPDVLNLVRDSLDACGFLAISAGSIAELHQGLNSNNVALALLDIGLPDGDGSDIIPEVKQDFPDMAVIMLTGNTDLQTALSCLRKGADDYVVKPIQIDKLKATIENVLEKRRLSINNRRYQKELEQARFRTQLLHDLAVKMNSAYLGSHELSEVLLAVLVGITAEEGLGFNRAFLALFDEERQLLAGRMAIGLSCRHEAGKVWHEMKQQNLHLQDIITNIRQCSLDEKDEINKTIRKLKVKVTDTNHILIKAAVERRCINVVNGQCDYSLPKELTELLKENTFVVVPLFSPSRPLGVIIADNLITGQPITDDLIDALEIYSSQASLAIEHSRLYTTMQNKITELEETSNELEKNKDLLVEAERYSAVGQVAAQLVHIIRNPITSIGGTARLLAKRTDNPEWLKFLDVMTRETAKVESTLEDLFNFVDRSTLKRESVDLYPLIHKAVLLFHGTMEKKKIDSQLTLPQPNPILKIDKRMIRQAIVHIIRNCIEAMPDGGTLEIIAEPRDDKVALQIRDTGIGLIDSDINKATSPFFTTKIHGAGMGLTLASQIINDHGGTISLSARKERGTKITIILPMHFTPKRNPIRVERRRFTNEDRRQGSGDRRRGARGRRLGPFDRRLQPEMNYQNSFEEIKTGGLG